MSKISTLLKTFQILCLSLSVVLCLFLFACYWRRFDGCTAVTLYPPWCWFLLGVLLLYFARSNSTARVGWGVLLLWLAFVAMFFDSPGALLRSPLPRAKPPGTFRVVTLNCASSIDAAREAMQLDPDVFLIQETPNRLKLKNLAEEFYGSGEHSRWHWDTSMVTRPTFERIDVPRKFSGNYIHNRVNLDENTTVELISIRLIPCPVRLDLWNPECWKMYRHNRKQRRAQLSQLAKYLETIPANHPVLVGGDFNAPAGDAVFKLLKPRLADAFPVAGRGWGRSFHSIIPVIRIDQIWSSKQLVPGSAFAMETLDSDHRMVVADFSIEASVPASSSKKNVAP